MKSRNIKDCISQKTKEALIKLNYQEEENKKLLPELKELNSIEIEKLIQTTNNRDFINRLIMSNNQEYLIKLITNENINKTNLIKLYEIFEKLEIRYLYQYKFLKNKNTPLSILKLIFNKCKPSDFGLTNIVYIKYFINHPKATNSFLKQILKKYPNQKEYFFSKKI